MNDADRIHALFATLALGISGCAPQVRPTTTEPAVVLPVATATASEVPSASPPPIAGEDPAPVPSATASATATVTKRPPRQPKGKPHIVEGRPFLVEGLPRLASAESKDGWSEALELGDVSEETREALVRHYTDWALAEHASIASFARFALQLLSLGAPSDLVARATEAMGDEVRHARLGFGLVRALSGKDVGPGPLDIENALGNPSLADILRLVVREGMIGETLAALEVSTAADLAESPALKRALATVATEEARHAELAWVFAAWALRRDPTLASIPEEEVGAWENEVVPAASGLERWGILDANARSSLRARGFAAIVQPLARRLCTSLSVH